MTPPANQSDESAEDRPMEPEPCPHGMRHEFACDKCTDWGGTPPASQSEESAEDRLARFFRDERFDMGSHGDYELWSTVETAMHFLRMLPENPHLKPKASQSDEALVELEHESVMASVAVGKWLSAALDDPNVCDAMKADIRRWFSSGHLYVAEVLHRIASARAEGGREGIEEAADYLEPHDPAFAGAIRALAEKQP